MIHSGYICALKQSFIKIDGNSNKNLIYFKFTEIKTDEVFKVGNYFHRITA